VAIESLPTFTKPARQRWESIPADIRQRLLARGLNVGKFVWGTGAGTLSLSAAQFDALVLGQPWQRLGEAGIIRVI
jgi:hypothetical protein